MCVGVVIWGLKRAGGNRTGVLRFFVFIFESESLFRAVGLNFAGVLATPVVLSRCVDGTPVSLSPVPNPTVVQSAAAVA